MHRRGSLPTTLSRARAGVRLQPAPAAAPQGQPHCPDSSRLVLHSCSGPMRIAPSPSHPDRGDRFSSVPALTRNHDTVLRNIYARMTKSQSSQHLSQLTAAVSLKHGNRNPNAVNWRTKRSWTAVTPQYDSELGLCPPEALIPRDEESSKEDRLLLPRFLLQAIVFAHSSYGRLFPNRPSLQGNPLCRSDWLRLRGISETVHDPSDS